MNKRQMRRRYLVNQRLQLGLAFRFFICMALVALISGWAVYYAIWRCVLEQFHGANLSMLYHAISVRLVLLGIGATACLSILSIFFSHKIAGPIYKMRLVLERSLENGQKPDEIQLRKGDAFKDFAESLNRFLREIC